MQEALKITIKLKMLDKTAFFENKNGELMASLLIWPNRNGEDQWGNVATVKQDMGAERKGEPSPILGNAKTLRKRKDAPAPAPKQTLKSEFEDADEIPF